MTAYKDKEFSERMRVANEKNAELLAASSPPVPEAAGKILDAQLEVARRLEANEATPVAVSEESRKLVFAHGDALFDCGNWDEESDERHDAVLRRAKDAQAALLSHIATIEKERDGARRDYVRFAAENDQLRSQHAATQEGEITEADLDMLNSFLITDNRPRLPFTFSEREDALRRAITVLRSKLAAERWQQFTHTEDTE